MKTHTPDTTPDTTRTPGHTPGPWKHWTNDFGFCSAGPSGDKPVCNIFLNMTAEGKANARLIAAAPELLEALRDCMAALESADGPSGQYLLPPEQFHALNIARAAIARATGKEGQQ